MGLIESRNIIWVALPISSPNKNPTHQGFSLTDHCESVVDRTNGFHLKRGRWFTNSPHQFRKPKECPKYGKHATKLSKEPSNSKTVFRKCFFSHQFSPCPPSLPEARYQGLMPSQPRAEDQSDWGLAAWPPHSIFLASGASLTYLRMHRLLRRRNKVIHSECKNKIQKNDACNFM